MENITLFDLLSRYSLILYQLVPYVSVGSLLNLASTSKDFRDLILQHRGAFRYLDLSTAKGARVDLPPIDVGGFNWRNERIDESTTAEDFYAGPIRGIFSFLRRKNVLSFVQVLILDHCSAPADILFEIISDPASQVRILSLIKPKNLNEKKFRDSLAYICRPSRPDGTPKLRGVYIFGVNPRPSLDNLIQPLSLGVTESPGAQLGAALNRKAHSALQSSGLAANVNPWYRNSGKVLPRNTEMLDWAMTLQVCNGLIYFDAVLCRGPRHIASSPIVQANPRAYLKPNIACIALRGCEICHSLPEGPANSLDAPSTRLPLIVPVPRHSSNIKTAQQPPECSSGTEGGNKGQNLYARCMACAFDRWCEGCGKFWCEDHYNGERSTRTFLQQIERLDEGGGGEQLANGDFWQTPSNSTSTTDIYVSSSAGASNNGGTSHHQQQHLKKECYDCGYRCHHCNLLTTRWCRICRGGYCLAHNDGSSEDTCDWCSRSGRRTREMY